MYKWSFFSTVWFWLLVSWYCENRMKHDDWQLRHTHDWAGEYSPARSLLRRLGFTTVQWEWSDKASISVYNRARVHFWGPHKHTAALRDMNDKTVLLHKQNHKCSHMSPSTVMHKVLIRDHNSVIGEKPLFIFRPLIIHLIALICASLFVMERLGARIAGRKNDQCD